MGTNAPMCVMYKNSLHGRYLPDRLTVEYISTIFYLHFGSQCEVFFLCVSSPNPGFGVWVLDLIMNAHNITFFIRLRRFWNNLETMTNGQAHSAIIKNLSNQVSTAVKGTGNEREFKKIFAYHTKQIKNVTKKLNKTVGHVNELAAVGSETTITFNKDVKSLIEKTGQTQDDIEDLERKLTEKIDKLEQEVKTLKVSLSYAQESASLKEGKNIFILFYRLSCSSKYSRKLFKLIV